MCLDVGFQVAGVSVVIDCLIQGLLEQIVRERLGE
jgi:hypothetical protein